ncbi:hypothetical protein MOQ_006700 [Trypanosoma cruzi marinkellei]|uniref:Uncharacterized protein n=1 Tax=Trypanosoma cruzi marinkellei TaxID=85056 RepID=K2MUX6_TRYCR|nr:hypothetical protein MOQ_006700 [Trypanosoma cruzi marinkellei]
MSLAVVLTDRAISVTFHTYPRAHHYHGCTPQVCTRNVGALDDAALGFVARYRPHFCVCRRCDGDFRQFAHSFTARPFDLFGTPHSAGRGYRCGLATLVWGACTRNSLFFPIPLWPCEVHAPQQTQRGVVLSWRVRYSPRLLFYGSVRVCTFSLNRGSTRAHVDGSGLRGDSHCGRTLFIARSTEGRARGCSLSVVTAAYPSTKLVTRHPTRRPTSRSSQTHGAPAWPYWPKLLFVSDG